jgi:DNA polymerase I-like protein with 3'-5' exonuclease and polymerase domains
MTDKTDDVSIFLDMLDLSGTSSQQSPVKVSVEKPKVAEAPILDDPSDFIEKSGFQRERLVPNIEKPWMKHHIFTLVRTIETVNQIVDDCIKSSFCSLDLETEGLDNRINWVDGKPETVHKIVGFCICHDGKEGFYIPVGHHPTDGGPDLNVTPVEGVYAAISRLCHAAIPEGTPEDIEKDPLSYTCKRPKVIISFWNAQFDQEFLFPITGIDWWHPESFEDGMLACFVKFAGDKRLSLKDKAKELLRDPDGNSYEMIKLKELFVNARNQEIRFQTLSPDEPGVIRYAGSDAICTYKVCQLPDVVLLCHEKHEFIYRIEKQVTCVMRVMERNRTKINRQMVREILIQQTELREKILERIQRFAREQRQWDNIDPNSPKQLSEFLFGPSPKGLDISPKPAKNEASGQYKTDADSLGELAKNPNAPPILKDVVEFREVEKFIGTYLEGLANNPDENDELRFSFKQTGAATGRFSAPAGEPGHGYSGVPIHGIPNGSEIRRVFKARDGYAMLKADYAGEEMRIAANVSNESVWINEFLHGSGDLHSITARAFFGKQEVTKEEREMGKKANFSLLYGGGPQAVIRATGCDMVEGKRRKQAFDRAVPIYASWIKGQHKKVKEQLGVTTAFGRWLPIPDAKSEDGAIRSACERHSTNYVIQGSGADIMKISLIKLHKALHKKGWLKNGGDDSVRMLLTVHDEVVFEIRYDCVTEVIPLIVDLMESPWRIPKHPLWKVPLVVEPLIGFNWISGYKVERMPKDYILKKDEVAINGFVYSTTRKPRTNKKGEIIESLDQNEVLDGKVFRILNPPWLAGYELGKYVPPGNLWNAVSENTALTETKVSLTETKKVEIEKTQETPPSVEVSIETLIQETKVESPKVSDDVPEVLNVQKTPEDDVLIVAINQLNEQTARQVYQFMINNPDENGPCLHVTDIVGTTLVAPSLNLRVAKEGMIADLRKHNLLEEKDNDA